MLGWGYEYNTGLPGGGGLPGTQYTWGGGTNFSLPTGTQPQYINSYFDVLGVNIDTSAIGNWLKDAAGDVWQLIKDPAGNWLVQQVFGSQPGATYDQKSGQFLGYQAPSGGGLGLNLDTNTMLLILVAVAAVVMLQKKR